MGLRITTNTTAMTAHRHLAASDGAMRISLERLATGFRVNRAADDAAGLAVSEGLRSQIGGLNQAVRNTRDAISLVQTAEGALDESAAILQRMRDLTVRAANAGAMDAAATAHVQREIDQLKSELTRIADTTTFNGAQLLHGAYRGTFQVGADVGETITLDLGTALGAEGLGVQHLGVTRDVDPAAISYGASLGGGAIPAGAGLLVFVGATAPRPEGIGWLRGTVTVDGKSVDLGAVTESDSDLDGDIDADDAVAQLNAAAAAAGITHRSDPFFDDGDDLIFRGPVPAAGASAADVQSASPEFAPPVPPASPAVEVITYGARGPGIAGPSPGGILFPDSTAADLPGFRGIVVVGDRRFDLGSVTYTDSNGDGTVDGGEALAQLNAAAAAAGLTVGGGGFSESGGMVVGYDVYEPAEPVLSFTGPVPPINATPAELAALGPVFLHVPDATSAIDAAIATVSSVRADLGAFQNRLEHTITRLQVSIENATAAESRIRDTDMAFEMTRFTRNQVMTQAGTAMLAQANQSAQSVLTLLRA